MLGKNYLVLSEYKNAMNHLHNSIYYDKINPDPYMTLGKYFYDKCKYDSSIYYYSILPDSLLPNEAYYSRGFVYQELGLTKEALYNFNKYLAKGSDSTMIFKIQNIIDKYKKKGESIKLNLTN